MNSVLERCLAAVLCARSGNMFFPILKIARLRQHLHYSEKFCGLPPHLIFVAGQDPLRDEGLAYAKKLEEAGVKTTLHIYPGVPHTFAEFWELESTTKFINDLVDGIGYFLGETDLSA
jgi:acetyl esterase/lipase